MKNKFFVYILFVSVLLVLTSCKETTSPENLQGKEDRNKPVEYVIVKSKDRARAARVLSKGKLELEEVEEEEKKVIEDNIDKEPEQNTNNPDKKEEKKNNN